jgi:hypothetical protein
LDAVVNPIHEVAGAARSAVNAACVFTGRQSVQDGSEMVNRLITASQHDPAGHDLCGQSTIHIVNALVREPIAAQKIVLITRVTGVHRYISVLEVLGRQHG